MVLTVGAGVDMPRLVLDAALGLPLPEGPLPFHEIGGGALLGGAVRGGRRTRRPARARRRARRPP